MRDVDSTFYINEETASGIKATMLFRPLNSSEEESMIQIDGLFLGLRIVEGNGGNWVGFVAECKDGFKVIHVPEANVFQIDSDLGAKPEYLWEWKRDLVEEEPKG